MNDTKLIAQQVVPPSFLNHESITVIICQYLGIEDHAHFWDSPQIVMLIYEYLYDKNKKYLIDSREYELNISPYLTNKNKLQDEISVFIRGIFGKPFEIASQIPLSPGLFEWTCEFPKFNELRREQWIRTTQNKLICNKSYYCSNFNVRKRSFYKISNNFAQLDEHMEILKMITWGIKKEYEYNIELTYNTKSAKAMGWVPPSYEQQAYFDSVLKFWNYFIMFLDEKIKNYVNSNVKTLLTKKYFYHLYRHPPYYSCNRTPPLIQWKYPNLIGLFVMDIIPECIKFQNKLIPGKYEINLVNVAGIACPLKTVKYSIYQTIVPHCEFSTYESNTTKRFLIPKSNLPPSTNSYFPSLNGVAPISSKSLLTTLIIRPKGPFDKLKRAILINSFMANILNLNY